ncbi:MAG: helix-turn-helix transcriptional regulator [Synergistaceae bacterium]|nr:helix-turn-helix transcriptional regulator [Synergistaceae bacterium]
MLEKAEFGKYLFRLRKAAGLSQEELAERIGVHLNTISQWENGVYIPKTPKLKKLAEALNTTETELLNGPAKQEFEVKIVMGVKNLTGLAGVEVASNSFIYGVDDSEPQIVLAGKVLIGTPEEREKALAEIVRKFKAACWMFDHKGAAEAEA